MLVNITFCKYPLEVLHLCAKCLLNLKIYISFLILDSKDIRDKQLTVSFNENLLESPLDTWLFIYVIWTIWLSLQIMFETEQLFLLHLYFSISFLCFNIVTIYLIGSTSVPSHLLTYYFFFVAKAKYTCIIKTTSKHKCARMKQQDKHI